MSDQWAPPVPARPDGWQPQNQRYHSQQQYQQPYQQQYPPPQQSYQQQYPPPPQQSYQQQYSAPSQQPYQQQYPPPQQSYQQSYPPPQQPYHHQQQYSYQQQPPPPPLQQFSSQPGLGSDPRQQRFEQPQHQQWRPQSRPIWQPEAGTTWQMVLHDPVDLDDDSIEEAAVWILDVFDTPAESVAELHRRGRKVIGYFSGGTYEDWRSDASKFSQTDMGKKLDDWEGEKWVQTASPAIRQIMIQRIELAVSKGFDGIDVDNVDGYDNKNGLGLSKDSAVDYVKFFAREAHSRGLACGLKNAADIIPNVIDDVQWIVQEQCVQYGDEEEYLPFIRQNKPVFNVEYPKGEDTKSSKCNNDKDVTGKALHKCEKAKNMGFSTIIKNIKLDQWIQVV